MSRQTASLEPLAFAGRDNDRMYMTGSELNFDVNDIAAKKSRRKVRDQTYVEPQRNLHRLVFKNGECNVSRANIKKRRQRYMADIFTTLVDIKWRWNLLNFVLAFMLSWLIFALAWWLICFSHGDLENYGRPGHKACVEEVYDFTTALLFSIETQQTIGFGTRHTNPHCPEAIFVMMFQSCFGVIIQALMTGLVFAKLSRPKKRAETLLFSKNAVVCKRDDQLCLLFRVGDMRRSHIVEAHVRAILVRKHVTQEGEIVPLYQHDLKLGDGETEGKLFMVWPVIVEHKINEESPLWEMSPDAMSRAKFELVVVLEGIVESTGMTTQARTSYLPEEILWGHKFERLVSFQKETNQYLIDFSKFHWTVAVEIPRCSAKDLTELQPDSDTSSSSEEDHDDVAKDGDDSLSSASGSARQAGRGTVYAGGMKEEVHRKSAGTSNGPPPNGILPNFMQSKGISNIAMAAFDIQNEEEIFNVDGGYHVQTYEFFK